MLTEVAASDAEVVAPLVLRGETISSLDGWLGVVYPFIDGVQPEVSDPGHAALMSAALACTVRSPRSARPTCHGSPR